MRLKPCVCVVLHPLSTSNHNTAPHMAPRPIVVLHPLSTSNHNASQYLPFRKTVVLHPLSTSNHNYPREAHAQTRVVLHPLSTSNHNTMHRIRCTRDVVLHPLSTSNHNSTQSISMFTGLYCILFLHQTTTLRNSASRNRRCIASSFYIKPQPRMPDTLIFGHLTASRHDTKRGGVHRGSRFDAVFTFSTNIRKIIFTEIRRCMSVQRAGARLRSDSSEANI